MISLDRNAGEWANNLFNVYEFIKNELFQINIEKNEERLDKLMPIIEDVRDTWHEAYKLSKK
ncbi:flagellar protein FliS [compost metagenome]